MLFVDLTVLMSFAVTLDEIGAKTAVYILCRRFFLGLPPRLNV